MKIAVTYEDGNVFQHFGHTEQFKIYTAEDGKIVSTLWLRQDDGTPLRGEIAVEGEIILTADFTDFSFYDTLEPS